MRILLADDDPKIHTIIELWLTRNGHQVSTARNGQRALEMMIAEHFDGLITDVNMPLMRGIDLVKHVLTLDDQPDIMIVLTSRCDLGELGKGVDSPKVHFFNKPFSPKALADLIEEVASNGAPR